MKDKTTAALLAFLLGGLGVHRFYLGQAGLGIVYLLFCWTLIPSFIALIDFLAFLLGSRQAFDRKYNHQYMNAGQSNNNNNVQTTVVNNVYTPNSHPAPSPQSTPNQSSSSVGNAHKEQMDALERIFNLKEKGILSAEEFEQEKARILRGADSSSQAEQSPRNSNDPFMG